MRQRKQPCTILLIIINVAVFLLLSFQGRTEDAGFLLEHGAMYVPIVLEYEEYYRVITSMFLHFGFDHLVNNMISLGFLGWQLEQQVGKIKFLLIYFFSGIAGNLLSGVWELFTGDYAVSAGASGAVFGIIGALVYIAMRNHGRIGDISSRGLLFMVFLTLYHGFTSTGIDNLAHIGGFVAGFIFSILLYRKKRHYRYDSYYN